MFVCPSLEQQETIWISQDNFRKISYGEFLPKFVDKIQFGLNSDKINRNFVWRPAQISDNNALISS